MVVYELEMYVAENGSEKKFCKLLQIRTLKLPARSHVPSKHDNSYDTFICISRYTIYV